MSSSPPIQKSHKNIIIIITTIITIIILLSLFYQIFHVLLIVWNYTQISINWVGLEARILSTVVFYILYKLRLYPNLIPIWPKLAC